MNETTSIEVSILSTMSVGFCRLCGEALYDNETQGPVDASGSCWCLVPGLHDVPREGTGLHEVQEWRRVA